MKIKFLSLLAKIECIATKPGELNREFVSFQAGQEIEAEYVQINPNATVNIHQEQKAFLTIPSEAIEYSKEENEKSLRKIHGVSDNNGHGYSTSSIQLNPSSKGRRKGGCCGRKKS